MYVASTKQPRHFVKAYHDVLESTELNSNEKLVYLFLLSYQETATVESIFPSNEYIAQRLGLSVRTVIRATATLAEAGLIAKTRRFNKSNTFEVTNCHVWTCQTVTSGRDKMADYKNNKLDQKEDQLEQEGQNQTSLSQEDYGFNETRIHCDKSDSDLILVESNSVKKEEVTETYASMPFSEDDGSLDDDDFFEPDTDPDYIGAEEINHMGHRDEQRNQQSLEHLSTHQQSSSSVPTLDEYKRTLGGNRVSQFQSKPAWL